MHGDLKLHRDGAKLLAGIRCCLAERDLHLDHLLRVAWELLDVPDCSALIGLVLKRLSDGAVGQLT